MHFTTGADASEIPLTNADALHTHRHTGAETSHSEANRHVLILVTNAPRTKIKGSNINVYSIIGNISFQSENKNSVSHSEIPHYKTPIFD
jgi:hypothetical protein